MDLAEFVNQILSHLRAMWEYRWRAALIAWLVCLLGWGAIYSIPDQYYVQASVYVDTQSILDPLLKGLTVESDPMVEVQMVANALMTRPHLERVMRKTGMDAKAYSPEARNELIRDLRWNIEISSPGRSNTYLIAYSNTDPSLAYRVVKVLLDTLIQDARGHNAVDQESAQAFLRDQIGHQEQILRKAELRLAEFKKRHVGEMPGTQGDYYTRLTAASQKLDELNRLLRDLQVRRTALRGQLSGENPVISSGSSIISTPYDERIRLYQEQLDSLRIKYTENHPDVIAAKEVLAELQAARSAALGNPLATRQDSAVLQNRVYESMKVDLHKLEVEISALQSRISVQDNIVKDFQATVDTVPGVEAELARLNRDYEVNKKQYESLLARLESARLSQEAEKQTEQRRFQVIDPPVEPFEPSGPNRTLYLTIVLLGGLVVGIGAAIVYSQINPVFSDREALREMTGLPVLGAVSTVWTRGQKAKVRWELASYAAVIMLLFSAYGGTVIFENQGVYIARHIIESLETV